jgi:3-phosphoglycerate kinase
MMANVSKKLTVSSRAGIQDIDVNVLQDKTVLVRVDYSVPLLIPGSGLPSGLPGAMHMVANDSKMRASMRTIRYLLDAGAIVLLISHLGRPDIPDHADEDDVDIRSHPHALQQQQPRGAVQLRQR